MLGFSLDAQVEAELATISLVYTCIIVGQDSQMVRDLDDMADHLECLHFSNRGNDNQGCLCTWRD